MDSNGEMTLSDTGNALTDSYNKELANKENNSKMGQDSKMPPQPDVKTKQSKLKKSKNRSLPSSNEEKAASKVAKEQLDAVRNKWCLDMRNKQQAWVAQREEENHQLLESFNNDVSSIQAKLYEIDLNDEDERDKLADELYALEKRIEKECFLLDVRQLKSKCRSIRECVGFTQAAAVAASAKSSSAVTKTKAPSQGKKKRPAKNDFDFDSPIKKGPPQGKKKGDLIAQVATPSDSPPTATAELVEHSEEMELKPRIGRAMTWEERYRGQENDANVLHERDEKDRKLFGEGFVLKRQIDTVMRYVSMKVSREYLERFNGMAHCELDVIDEVLRNSVYTTLLRVPVDERDRNVVKVRDSALASLGSMDELMELVRIVPGGKRKHTWKSEESRQSIVANAKRMTQAKHDALRDGNNSFQALHLMCTKSLVEIPDSDGLCNGDVVKFRRNGGFVLTEKRLIREVGKTMGIAAGCEFPKLREYKFVIKTEVTDDEGNTKLKTYKGDIRSLSDDTTLYFTHENFGINTTPLELASMTQDTSIRALRREPSTFVFGPSGCNLTANSNGHRPCREEKCIAIRATGNTNFDCCINCGKEFEQRYTNEKGWEAARRKENLPITVKVSCPNEDKGCNWSCQSNQTHQYATHIGHCNKKVNIELDDDGKFA